MTEAAKKKVRTVSVTLFKESGKYYTTESWRAPEGEHIGPYDMVRSPDFRRIGGGKVLVDSEAHSHSPEDRNWGFPHLI